MSQLPNIFSTIIYQYPNINRSLCSYHALSLKQSGQTVSGITSFEDLAHEIVDKVNVEEDGKFSYKYDDFVVHVLVKGKTFTIITICSSDFQNRRAFNFLQRVSENLARPHLVTLTKEFNKNEDGDKLLLAQQGLDAVTSQAIKNIDTVMGNSEKVDLLLQSSDNLLYTGNLYRVTSNQLHRKMLTRYLILILMIASIIVGIASIIFMFVWYLCGFPRWEYCIKQS